MRCYQLHYRHMITRIILICQYPSQLILTLSSTILLKVKFEELGSEGYPSASTIALIGMRLLFSRAFQINVILHEIEEPIGL